MNFESPKNKPGGAEETEKAKSEKDEEAVSEAVNEQRPVPKESEEERLQKIEEVRQGLKSLEKETAKKRLLERFNALQDNEYGLKDKAGIRVILGALSQRDGEGKYSLETSFDDFLNRRSRDSKTGHIDAINGPKNPDMSEWLKYNERAVDTLRQMIHDNVVEVGQHITAKEAYDLLT